MAARRITRMRAFFVVHLLLAASLRASAGPHGDALGKCLLESMTAAEKTTLMRWVFATVALHPDLKGVSAVTPEQRAALSKETARVYQRHLMQTCRAQARLAINHEGLASIPASFAPAGAAAAQGLFADPNVAEALEEPVKYFDQQKFWELASPPKQ